MCVCSISKKRQVKKIKLCQVYTRTQSCLSTCDWCIDTTNGDHAGGCAKAASEPASAVQFSVSRRKRISKKNRSHLTNPRNTGVHRLASACVGCVSAEYLGCCVVFFLSNAVLLTFVGHWSRGGGGDREDPGQGPGQVRHPLHRQGCLQGCLQGYLPPRIQTVLLRATVWSVWRGAFTACK